MRILLVRTSALGDVVHCLPVLTALRRHLPDARLGWVVEEAMAPVLAGHPDLDEILTVRLRHWSKRPFSGGTVRELRGFLALNRAFDDGERLARADPLARLDKDARDHSAFAGYPDGHVDARGK